MDVAGKNPPSAGMVNFLLQPFETPYQHLETESMIAVIQFKASAKKLIKICSFILCIRSVINFRQEYRTSGADYVVIRRQLLKYFQSKMLYFAKNCLLLGLIETKIAYFSQKNVETETVSEFLNDTCITAQEPIIFKYQIN